MASTGRKAHVEAYLCLRQAVQDHVRSERRPHLHLIPLVYGGLENLSQSHPFFGQLMHENLQAAERNPLNNSLPAVDSMEDMMNDYEH